MALTALEHIRPNDMATLLKSPHLFPTVREFFAPVYDDWWPHMVHYAGGSVVHTTPDQFCTLKATGPSDCVWIVPGTTQRKWRNGRFVP